MQLTNASIDWMSEMLVSILSVMRLLLVNNILNKSDPDVFLVRSDEVTGYQSGRLVMVVSSLYCQKMMCLLAGVRILEEILCLLR